MVFEGNFSFSVTQTPSAILVATVGAGFMPVCGAIRRNRLIKE